MRDSYVTGCTCEAFKSPTAAAPPTAGGRTKRAAADNIGSSVELSGGGESHRAITFRVANPLLLSSPSTPANRLSF